MRCVAHILNLVAKCIMQQFDAPKNKGNCSAEQDDEDINATLHALAEEMEEMEDENECGEEGEGDSSEENEKLFDRREGMMEEEIHELDENVRTMHLMHAKVC